MCNGQVAQAETGATPNSPPLLPDVVQIDHRLQTSGPDQGIIPSVLSSDFESTAVIVLIRRVISM